MIVFLHGGSARGSGRSLLERYGPPAVAARSEGLPFIVLTPQCPEGEIWTDTEALIALMDSVSARYRVDRRRIYLTGISMGGRGVWYLAYKHPERFAAIAPVCGMSPIAAWAGALRNTPVWVFHGAKDNIVPLSESEEMVRGLKAAGNEPRFTVLAGRDHFISDVFEDAELYRWFLKHVLPTAEP